MNKKTIACLLAGFIAVSGVPFSTSAEDTHNVVIIDFNGLAMQTIAVPHGSDLDLSGIDTCSLNQHPDIYTQIAFNEWGNLPESGIVTEDIAVYALFRKMTIACETFPDKTEYYSNTGNINLNGLKVTITDYVQTPEKDKNGAFIVREEVTNIESKCTTVPATLDEAFADGKTSASVDVYPINSDQPIISYDITYFKGLGDIDNNGLVESTDASSILTYYSYSSIGGDAQFSEYQKQCADVNRDNVIDSIDASEVLAYYSALSITTDYISWDDFLSR